MMTSEPVPEDNSQRKQRIEQIEHQKPSFSVVIVQPDRVLPYINAFHCDYQSQSSNERSATPGPEGLFEALHGDEQEYGKFKIDR
jgi:hypothetical protein